MFIYALSALMLWGGADLFYKKGSLKEDKYSPLKVIVAVGLIMGIHATVTLLVDKPEVSFNDLIRYLPVSGLYILSMGLGFWGLRYLDLSVSSPVQNASGALVTVLLVIFFQQQLSVLDIVGIVVVSLGVISIGILEKKEEHYVPLGNEKKYHFSVLAILFPILYCIFDALGTFGDAIYLDELALISEDAALIAYEYTYLICAVVCIVFLLIKKERINIKSDKHKLFAGVFETGGQIFYTSAMAANAAIAAPMIASYCVVSVILSKIFLNEKLSVAKYIAVAVVIVGVITLGVSEGLSGG